ncbi:hypothetical protein H6G35_23285 [Aulosira sp. FACHB-113]|nr:hypothetical protein [Aulosira sp. FACHB-113]
MSAFTFKGAATRTKPAKSDCGLNMNQIQLQAAAVAFAGTSPRFVLF